MGHALGIELAEPRIDTDADRQSVGVGRIRDHDTVRMTVVTPTDQRSDDAAAEDLVVVATDHRLLRCDVGVMEQRQQGGSDVGADRRLGTVAAR